jgi:hypothetical protein
MKSMTIPGLTMAKFLLLVILGTTLGLFISLPISHNNPKTIIELINNKD